MKENDVFNCGYEIIKGEYFNETCAVVLGYKEGAVSPWVTWVYNKTHDSYYFGHYFCEYTSARIDYHERALHALRVQKIAKDLEDKEQQ